MSWPAPASPPPTPPRRCTRPPTCRRSAPNQKPEDHASTANTTPRDLTSHPAVTLNPRVSGCLLGCVVMSVSLWPVFEDGQKHSLWDEGVLVLDAYEDLDAIASAAGSVPLSAFDQHADVPDDVIARLA